MRVLIYCILITFILSGKSYAYLDPGSAGIIQMIVAIIAGAFASIAIYWNKFKNFLSRIFKRKDQEKELYKERKKIN